MITIFTPIYNRAYIVENLYHSLLRQANYDFEWLIVDDGSTDHIAELIHQLGKNPIPFTIRFYQQENGGKHRAVNTGVRLAHGDAFFIVDSDDYLEKSAVENISKYWKDIKDDNKFAGISGLRKCDNGKIIGGEPYFKEFIDATNLERDKFGLNGDKAEVYKTEILRKFPFPEYENEKFITEAVVWNKIADEGYKLRWINRGFLVCNYLQDGMTAKGSQLFYDNPRGWAHYLQMERECGIVGQELYLKKCYYYYERENVRFAHSELNDMLGLNDRELNIITKQFGEFSHKLINICTDKKICIYGYGCWGKRLKRYLDSLGFYVDYVIDKQYESISEIKAYPVEMDLPLVNVVIIALGKDPEKAAETVRSKMPRADVVLCRDIKPELW